MPGKRVDLTPFMRIDAQSLRSSAMELAFVSSAQSGTGGHTTSAAVYVETLFCMQSSPLNTQRKMVSRL